MTFASYVDLRHFSSGSGTDEASGSIRGCGGFGSVLQVDVIS